MHAVAVGHLDRPSHARSILDWEERWRENIAGATVAGKEGKNDGGKKLQDKRSREIVREQLAEETWKKKGGQASFVLGQDESGLSSAHLRESSAAHAVQRCFVFC